MISFNGVNMRYKDLVVMENFCEEFEENKVNCILGPSGCGKTTMLNLIGGIIDENSGKITKPGRVSYIFQDDSLIPQKTARQNLELVLKSVYKSAAELRKATDTFLELSELYKAAELYPHEMSGGMRRRLALIRAFAYPSDILLMDEPFKALDISLKDNIIKSFLALHEKDKRTVLFVTHNIDEALLTGDFIHLYSGKPMSLQQKIAVNGEKRNRKIYDENITILKNEVYKQTEKWQLKN
ncbi:MAG: ATP-binding cassette domain-containing protein [Oscillospiraceae bacterium]|nr:ATP-binding cassette domain-containing protein [Oscillospiraceae bacterium]